MANAGIKLRKHVLHTNFKDEIIVDVPLSFDGSWQKRYGFNSLLGVVLAISIDTGCVIDYEVKSLVCFTCKKNKDASAEWKDAHTKSCCINHEGSSGKMEKDGTVSIFLRSVETRKLRYTTFVGDGDSSSFGAVVDAVNSKYGDQYPVEKEDCIGHIQKRLGTALRTYKNKRRGAVLSDGKSTGGKGRLTDQVVDRMQTSYGYAIRNNKGDQAATIKAIWAIYHHMIIGPQYECLESQHSYCPRGERSWCKYHRDKIFDTQTYDRTKCLPFVFRGELKDIFTRLSSPELLKSCERGLTQNQNEALNNMIWAKCPKRTLVSKRRLIISVCEAIVKWNEGGHARKLFLESLNVKCGPNIIAGLRKENMLRLPHAQRKICHKYHKRRQVLRQQRKKKKKDDSYIPGAFSTKVTPDVDYHNHGLSLKKTKEVHVTFVSNDNVTFIKDYHEK